MKDLLPQGRSAFILDYSRTARHPNEEVVILRELFVRRKPLTGMRSFPSLCLFLLGRERPERPDSPPSLFAEWGGHIPPLDAVLNIVSAS